MNYADRFDMTGAPETMADLIGRAIVGRFPYGIEARPWKRPEYFGAGWNGLDLFLIEAGSWAWWAVVNRTPTGWDRTIDGAPVGMRSDDPRWADR